MGKQRTEIGIWEVHLERESGSILGEVIPKVCFQVRGWNYLKKQECSLKAMLENIDYSELDVVLCVTIKGF